MTMAAGLDQRPAAAWPRSSPLTVEWPWAGERDPVVGEPIGWNWEEREIAVVTGVPSIVDAPPMTQPWPYTLTVEIRPMPEEWFGPVTVFDLISQQRLDVEWYTRWNRAYAQFAKDENGCPIPDESGTEVKRVVATGWLGVVLDQ